MNQSDDSVTVTRVSLSSTVASSSGVVDNVGGGHHRSGSSGVDTVAILLSCGTLSLLTIIGNVLVLIAFKVDKQLQTVSNYFLLSLALADFLIGCISMPLSLVYIVNEGWPLGPLVCDAWLAIDYLNSNASVLNLLLISFDRYFSVTRPLTYRARRTTRRACAMIAGAWTFSLITWPPTIIAWPAIEGRRTVPSDKCYIPFLESNIYVTISTAFIAFWFPVSVMCALYWRIWRETEKRYRDLTTLVLVSHSRDAISRSDSRATHSAISGGVGGVGGGSGGGVGSSGTRVVHSCWRHCCPRTRAHRYASTPIGGDSAAPPSTETPPTSESIYTIVIQLERAGDHHVTMIAEQEHTPGPPSPPPRIRAPIQPERKSERKAAKTLSAILAAFIVTWTPYNILVLVKTFSPTTIDSEGNLWQFAYYLCYVNSTLNPLCYALCNQQFRQTYVRILLCRTWKRQTTSATSATAAAATAAANAANITTRTAQQSQQLAQTMAQSFHCSQKR